MEIEVIQRKENKLFEREEIHFILRYDGATPPRSKVKEAIKNNLGLSGFIVIEYIKPSFGSMEAKVYAKVYPSEKKARQYEADYVIARNVKKSEKKAEQEAEAKAEVKEEEKAEEKGEGNE